MSEGRRFEDNLKIVSHAVIYIMWLLDKITRTNKSFIIANWQLHGLVYFRNSKT